MGGSTDGAGLSRDVVLGKLALEKGWIDATQFRLALAEVATAPGASLSDLLLERGLLRPAQLEELLAILRHAAAPTFPPFGPFTIHRELGRGAMGVVYDAERQDGSRVALKLLIEPPGRDPVEARGDHERFLRESELLRQLPEHPGLVKILDAGIHDGRRYLVMDLVDGVPFNQWRRKGSINVRQQVAVLRDAALAIHHAHERGVVHRDLKPENLLVDREHRPRVTDFGLAKAVGAHGLPSLTASGSAVGTPAYMSPEQIQGLRTVDRRSDVWSLGVMLYELLTGRRPFTGESPYELMMRAVHDSVVPPSKVTDLKINPVLYRNLENICLLALEKDPGHRYPDAASFARDLTRWLKGEEFKIVLPRSWRRWRAKKILPKLALVASLGVAAAVGALWRDGRSPAATPAVAPASLAAGALGEYHLGMNHNALVLRRVDLRPRFNDPAAPLWDHPPGGSSSRRWTGLLPVPADGSYLFILVSPDPSRVWIDGELRVSGSGELRFTASLAAGHHPMRIEHAHPGRHDTLSLSWKPQSSTDEPLPIGPATLMHDPTRAELIPAPQPRPDRQPFIPGAEEGESLRVLAHDGSEPIRKTYAAGGNYWKGSWSGTSHLWWGGRTKLGDRLKLRFSAGEARVGTLVLGVTRCSDHGVFRVLVNDREVARALDLFEDVDLRTGPVSIENVPLVQGPNTLEFEIVGSNPAAREWNPGSGLYKLGLDYVLVK